ncbi:hypothetical protein ACWD5R_17890 [Streptomyces sp. NPDC002514]|uniref:hypothetical protein n=1 Tax=Streptomyces sp. NPDC001270 TaxID=3364554 RepID=UPI0036C88299
MTRTPEDSFRRRTIADLAAGFTRRATVALYARLGPSEDPESVIARLRRYAHVRDWAVAGVVIDRTAADVPLSDRPNWPQAQQLITSGQAQGLVTTSRLDCISTPSGLSLDDWLSEHRAFLAEETGPDEGRVR